MTEVKADTGKTARKERADLLPPAAELPLSTEENQLSAKGIVSEDIKPNKLLGSRRRKRAAASPPLPSLLKVHRAADNAAPFRAAHTLWHS